MFEPFFASLQDYSPACSGITVARRHFAGMERIARFDGGEAAMEI
jgi:hypothetical protein